MSSVVYDDLIRQNRRSSRLLLAGAFVVLATIMWVLLGSLLGPELMLDPVTGLSITAFGAGLGLLLTFLSYRSGPSLALRAAKARPVSFAEAPELHRLLDEVCVSAGLTTTPKLYVVEDPAPNAFATGLSLEDSHVAVTTGLVERLPRYELRAVLAHEVAHIVNDDIRAVTIAVATAGLVALLADVLVRMTLYGGRGRARSREANAGQALLVVVGVLAAILAPLAAQLIRFAVSRQREYLADATAARILRDPQSMVDALRRLEMDPTTAAALRGRDRAPVVRGAERDTGEDACRRDRPGASRRTRPCSSGSSRLAQLNAGTVDPDRPLKPSHPLTVALGQLPQHPSVSVKGTARLLRASDGECPGPDEGVTCSSSRTLRSCTRT
jgi:heat shock protein HtpX